MERYCLGSKSVSVGRSVDSSGGGSFNVIYPGASHGGGVLLQKLPKKTRTSCHLREKDVLSFELLVLQRRRLFTATASISFYFSPSLTPSLLSMVILPHTSHSTWHRTRL
jgi:hypothetical protein